MSSDLRRPGVFVIRTRSVRVSCHRRPRHEGHYGNRRLRGFGRGTLGAQARQSNATPHIHSSHLACVYAYTPPAKLPGEGGLSLHRSSESWRAEKCDRPCESDGTSDAVASSARTCCVEAASQPRHDGTRQGSTRPCWPRLLRRRCCAPTGFARTPRWSRRNARDPTDSGSAGQGDPPDRHRRSADPPRGRGPGPNPAARPLPRCGQAGTRDRGEAAVPPPIGS